LSHWKKKKKKEREIHTRTKRLQHPCKLIQKQTPKEKKTFIMKSIILPLIITFHGLLIAYTNAMDDKKMYRRLRRGNTWVEDVSTRKNEIVLGKEVSHEATRNIQEVPSVSSSTTQDAPTDTTETRNYQGYGHYHHPGYGNDYGHNNNYNHDNNYNHHPYYHDYGHYYNHNYYHPYYHP